MLLDSGIGLMRCGARDLGRAHPSWGGHDEIRAIALVQVARGRGHRTERAAILLLLGAGVFWRVVFSCARSITLSSGSVGAPGLVVLATGRSCSWAQPFQVDPVHVPRTSTVLFPGVDAHDSVDVVLPSPTASEVPRRRLRESGFRPRY